MIAQMDDLYIKTNPKKVITRLISYAFFEGRPLTTRGRWINPLLFLLFKALGKLPFNRKIKKPVFILGTGRSGTTILGKVLSMHRDVGFLNEPKAIWHSIYRYEDLTGNYSRDSAFYRVEQNAATKEMIARAHRIIGAYLSLTNTERVVDKYPELIFRHHFVRALFPDAKYLFIIRNGWDTCQSIQTWSFKNTKKNKEEIHDWWGVNRRKWKLLVEQIIPEHSDLAPNQAEIAGFTRHTDMAAVEWIVTMREGFRFCEGDPVNIMAVKFEELSQQPGPTLQRISRFLELDNDAVFSSYGEKILHPVKQAREFSLHPIIVAPFYETMKKLGYV